MLTVKVVGRGFIYFVCAVYLPPKSNCNEFNRIFFILLTSRMTHPRRVKICIFNTHIWIVQNKSFDPSSYAHVISEELLHSKN